MARQTKYTPEQWAQVDELMAQGASVTEAANTTGVPRGSIYQRMRRQTDPKPGGNKKARKRNEPISDEKLVSTFTKVAAFPAVPAKVVLHCDYCTQHFASTAPDVAGELVGMSREYPALRDVLESIHKGWEKAAWAGVIVGWMGVPIAHHMLPAETFALAAMLLGAQQDTTVTPPQNGHTHRPFTPSEPPVDNPFANVDTDTLMNMASKMGVQFTDVTDATVVEGVNDASTTEAAIDAALANTTEPADETAADAPDPNDSE